MKQIVRLTALLAIVYVVFSILGKTTTQTTLAGGADADCAAKSYSAALTAAVDAVDYAGAVLIANGEVFAGQSAEDLRLEIAALPAFDDSDGISADEREALDALLTLGRQLAYALATQDLNRLIEIEVAGIRVASAADTIDFDVLEILRGGC